MDKLNYTKDLLTENTEVVSVSAYKDSSYIYIYSTDDEEDTTIIKLTIKEAQRVKRYLEDAITTNIINWEEE